MTKRVKAVLLTAALTCSLITGCSGGGKQESSSKDTQVPVESTAAAGQAKAADVAASGATAGSETDWPKKPIEIVVPGGAGGDTDLNTRMLASALEKELGVSIVITNVKGGSGTVGARQVLDGEPDGYSLLMFHPGMLLTELTGVADFSYADYDMAGNAYMDETSIWCVSNDAPYDDLQGLLEWGKNNKVQYATEYGSFSHLIGLAVEEATGTSFTIVDAGGAADKIAALMGNQIELIYCNYGLVTDYIENGDFKIIGLVSEERNPLFPDVPTFKEQGVDVAFSKYYNLYWPKGVDPAIQAKFAEALEKVCKNKAFIQEAHEKMYVDPCYMSPEDTKVYLDEKFEEYKKLLHIE